MPNRTLITNISKYSSIVTLIFGSFTAFKRSFPDLAWPMLTVACTLFVAWDVPNDSEVSERSVRRGA